MLVDCERFLEDGGHALGHPGRRIVSEMQCPVNRAEVGLCNMSRASSPWIAGSGRRCHSARKSQRERHCVPCLQPAVAITPPPRQTSPSYSTADWPGVTAHCGCGEVQAEAAVRRLDRGRRPRRPADSASSPRSCAGRRRVARHPARVVGASARDSSHGWSWPCTTHSVLVAMSLRATNQGVVLAAAALRALFLDAADAQALALAQRVEATGPRARRWCGRARP